MGSSVHGSASEVDAQGQSAFGCEADVHQQHEDLWTTKGRSNQGAVQQRVFQQLGCSFCGFLILRSAQGRLVVDYRRKGACFCPLHNEFHQRSEP